MLSEGFLQKLDALRLSMRAPAQGGAGGLRRSRALGSSVEFSDFREYAAGDDLRRLDWNAYARFDRLFLKLFMEEQETQVHILLDASASMAGEKWRMAQELAQLLCYLSLRGGDRATVYALNGGVRRSEALSGRAGYMKASAFIEGLAPQGELRLCERMPRVPLHAGRGVSLLITDLMSADGYQTALQSLQYRRQEVTLLHVLSPEEMQPAYAGMLRLIDSETGEARELLMNGEMLAAYQRALSELLRGAEGFCHARDMQYLRLTTDMDMEKAALRALAQAGLVG